MLVGRGWFVRGDRNGSADVFNARAESERGIRLAQKMHVGPCIPVGIQLEKAAVGPTSGPTWGPSHSRVAGKGRG